MATPCVAGTIALMLSKNSELTPAEIDEILERTAVPLSAHKNNDFGSGRIDALAAVNAIGFENVSETVPQQIQVHPNPANDFVTIKSGDPNVSLKHVEVYDITGRKVISEDLEGQSQGFSINKLHPGIYNVRIQTNNGRNTNLKLVVQ